MSVSEAQRFSKDFQSDSSLKAKLQAMPGSTPDERIAAIKSAGYDVSMSDIEGKGPMDDSALEGVAGGGKVGDWFKHVGGVIKKGWNDTW